MNRYIATFFLLSLIYKKREGESKLVLAFV